MIPAKQHVLILVILTVMIPVQEVVEQIVLGDVMVLTVGLHVVMTHQEDVIHSVRENVLLLLVLEVVEVPVILVQVVVT